MFESQPRHLRRRYALNRKVDDPRHFLCDLRVEIECDERQTLLKVQ